MFGATRKAGIFGAVSRLETACYIFKTACESPIWPITVDRGVSAVKRMGHNGLKVTNYTGKAGANCYLCHFSAAYMAG